MGRRRKGRPVSGWVIIDKPAGPTSTAVVNKVRWAFDAQKAGHAGTLDPAATGILAVALGEATKTVPYITDATKAYEFTVRLGASTNTDDAEGEIIATHSGRPTDTQIVDGLQNFIGDIQQIPPKYSAVKVDGQRAYALARGGADVTLDPRPLFVESLVMLDRPDPDTVVLEMVCGKGGYVRSIARDLGAQLGCLGHVLSLRRIWSGPFELDDAVTLDTIEPFAKSEGIDAYLLPVEAGLTDMIRATTTAEGAAKIKNGNPGICFAQADYGDQVWISHDGTPLGIGVFKGGEFHPSRVFNL